MHVQSTRHVDHTYADLCRYILARGKARPDRTGTGTIGIFGYQMRFDLQDGFPLLTTKNVHWKSVAHELLWMLSGSTNVKDLQKHGVTIWDEWARHDGSLGPVYGKQWRRFGVTFDPGDQSPLVEEVDQIAEAFYRLKDDPHSRRHIVTAWDPCAKYAALPPCHVLFQFYVSDGELSCHLYQRSADVFLGLPFNIASYALLTHLFAHGLGLKVGELVHSLGDAHIYANHVDQVKELLTREPRPMPELRIACEPRLPWEYRFEDLSLEGYDPHPAIKAEVSV